MTARGQHGGRARGGPRGTHGFTLVELLIAIALTIILIGTLVFIFQGSTQIITRTQRRIEAFQNVRRLVDLMEEDIGNAIKTADMEFFLDNPGNRFPGHYDVGEEIALLHAGNDPFGTSFAPPSYFNGPVFLQREYTDVNGNLRRNDALYLRTLTSVLGQARPALVRYELGDLNQRLPTMRRTLFYQQLDPNPANPPVTVRQPPNGPGDVVADGILEVEIQLFFKENTVSGSGAYLSLSEILDPTIIQSFRTGELVDVADGNAGGLPTAIQPIFEGQGVLELRGAGDVVLYADNDSQFPQVRLGDRVFLFADASLDAQFPPRDLRIQSTVAEDPATGAPPTNLNDPTARTVIRFEEPIDLTGLPNPLPVSYRIGWLPSSIQVRFRIRDLQAREEFDHVRVFKILTS